MRKAEITLDFQNYIENPPVPKAQLYSQSCSNDGATIESWRTIWSKNIHDNHKRYGSFREHGIGQIFGRAKGRPVIVAGAGPSLKYNGDELKNKGDVTLVSCLHNFHFMEDRGIVVDYYVTLDAGEITIEEVYEGGSKLPEEYWALTKGRTLLAYIGTSPRLLEKWQGKVIFFNCPVPDAALMKEIDELEKFNQYVSTGGNVLGACLYIAKGFLGASVVAFVGADFSFSYDKKFHAWDSKYDATLGHVIRAIDIYGNKCVTWQSYANFKAWFDWVTLNVPGIYVNCTEGGIFGAYPDGNLMSLRQMELAGFLRMMNMSEELRPQVENPATEERRILF